MLATTGCRIRRFYHPDTGKLIYESKGFGNNEKFDEVVVTEGTNSIKIKGYVNDQVAFAERIAGAVATAVVKGAKTP